MTNDGDRPGEGWNSGVPEVEELSAGTVAVQQRNYPVGIARKPHNEFTPERQETFLQEYAFTGRKAHSANAAGVSFATVRQRERDDEDFAALVVEAKEHFDDAVLAEAQRRAVEGWLEPVFSQKTGEQIGVVRKFSDRLLEILLKASKREMFQEAGGGGFAGGVLVVPVATLSPEQWEREYGGQVAGPGEKLPAPK